MASRAPIRFGIVGSGLSASVQARVLSLIDDARVPCFMSADADRANDLAQRYPGADVETSLGALVRREDVDIVSITTPPARHLPAASAAIEAGKAVLCEKPFALDAEEARTMRDLASAARIPTFVNFEFRRFGPRAHVKQLVDDGYVGRIRSIFMIGSSNYYQLKGDDQGSWWLSSAEGGGWLGAAASHDLDMLRFVGGEISEVCADLPQYVPAHPVRESSSLVSSDVDDAAHLLIGFENGARGVLATTAAAATPTLGNRIEVYGDEGTLLLLTPTVSGGPVYDGTQLLGRRHGDSDFTNFPFDAPATSSGDPHTGPLYLWLRDVVVSMEAGTATAPTFDDGFQNQLLLDAARKSHATRGWVRIAH